MFKALVNKAKSYVEVREYRVVKTSFGTGVSDKNAQVRDIRYEIDKMQLTNHLADSDYAVYAVRTVIQNGIWKARYLEIPLFCDPEYVVKQLKEISPF